jgi:hypothetical protein
LAAVDDERVADGEPGIVGAEPKDRRGYFVDIADSADRFLRDERVTVIGHVVDEASDHLGVDDSAGDKGDLSGEACVAALAHGVLLIRGVVRTALKR